MEEDVLKINKYKLKEISIHEMDLIIFDKLTLFIKWHKNHWRSFRQEGNWKREKAYSILSDGDASGKGEGPCLDTKPIKCNIMYYVLFLATDNKVSNNAGPQINLINKAITLDLITEAEIFRRMTWTHREESKEPITVSHARTDNTQLGKFWLRL